MYTFFLVVFLIAVIATINCATEDGRNSRRQERFDREWKERHGK